VASLPLSVAPIAASPPTLHATLADGSRFFLRVSSAAGGGCEVSSLCPQRRLTTRVKVSREQLSALALGDFWTANPERRLSLSLQLCASLVMDELGFSAAQTLPSSHAPPSSAVHGQGLVAVFWDPAATSSAPLESWPEEKADKPVQAPSAVTLATGANAGSPNVGSSSVGPPSKSSSEWRFELEERIIAGTTARLAFPVNAKVLRDVVATTLAAMLAGEPTAPLFSGPLTPLAAAVHAAAAQEVAKHLSPKKSSGKLSAAMTAEDLGP